MSFTKQILTFSGEEIDRRPDKKLVVDSATWSRLNLLEALYERPFEGDAHIYPESNK